MIEKRKILIVEDDSFIVDIYQTKFLQEGFDVLTAENGVKALEILDKEIPDIILLDMMMPQMGGMDVLEKIKENENTKRIPIIMLTNIAESEDIAESQELGVDDYLIKSHFTPTEVMEKVNLLLEK